jgi:class 3 adenylate cyclase/CheY-like chemotaxis protein
MDSSPRLSDFVNLSSTTSTFVSIDVVGSTGLKTGENEQDVIYTFLSYHKLVSDATYAAHGEVITITGDGIMCRFQRADDAMALAQTMLKAIPPFNKRQNRLARPFTIRVGVHTGEVYENQSANAGQWISQTLDITAKLQQSCEPNTARLSEVTINQLKGKVAGCRRVGWNAALSMNVYEYRDQAGAVEAKRSLPDPAHVLVVEHELDEVSRLKKVLFGRRHESLTAYTQNQAALCLAKWNTHLVLLSMDLAWETGWELLTGIRSDERLSGIPVITMSRQTTGDVVQKAFRMGSNGFLRKPLEDQQVIKRIDLVLREFYL